MNWFVITVTTLDGILSFELETESLARIFANLIKGNELVTGIRISKRTKGGMRLILELG